MQSPIPVAIVGTGYIAAYHLEVLKHIPNVAIVGACDPSAARLDSFCTQFHIPHRATTLDDLVASARPSVVHILTPPATHYAMAKDALARGLDVFLEKPMALAAAHCRDLLQSAQENNRHLGVNHNLVHLPTFQELLRRIAAKEIGPIEHVTSINNLPLAQLDAGDHGHWMFREPGNILYEQGPHPLSLVQTLIGSCTKVAATTSRPKTLANGNVFHSQWTLDLECQWGTAHVFLGWGKSLLEQSLQVIGRDGTAFLDLQHGALKIDRPTKYLEPIDRMHRLLSQGAKTAWTGCTALANYGLSTLKLRGRSDAYYLSMQGAIEEFYRQIQEPRAKPSLLGLHVVETIDKAVEAARLPVAPPKAVAHLSTIAERPGEILVLGGTGFIGRRLVALLQRAGHPVRMLARKTPHAPLPKGGPPIRLVVGDIRNPDDVSTAIRGCRAVFHLASAAPPTWAEYQSLFIDATRAIATACIKHGVEQLHYTSSIAALYLGDPDDVVTEETMADSMPEKRSEYSRAKILCEQMLLEMYAREQLPVTIHRPGVVVGAHGMVDHLGVGYWPNGLHCVSWGSNVDRPLPFVLADDVALALQLSLTAKGIAGKSLNLVGDTRITAREYVQAASELAHRRITLHRPSCFHWQSIDVAKWFVKLCARKPENPFPSYRDLVSRSLATPFDCTKTKAWLGWAPTRDRADFIERGIRLALVSRGLA